MVEVLLRLPSAGAVEDWLFTPGQTIHAPYLIDIEVAQVVRRYAASGVIDAVRGQATLANLVAFPLRRYPHDLLLPRVWALRNNLTAYDAAYVALAETLDAPLITRDKRLAASAGHHARVAVI